MKNRIIFVSLLLLSITALKSQVNFIEINSSEEMEKVWAEAKNQNKPVFVDIYATWCGPCKWMDANVFATEAAGEYMNSGFINVKMDGESSFGGQFAMQSGLSAYPSLFVYNSEKILMNTIVGAKPWEELYPALSSTLEYFPVLEVMQNKFESGILKKEEYPGFVKALREMNKPDYGQAVAKKYQADFVKEEKMSEEDLQVLAFYIPQNSDNWKMLTASIEKLRDALGSDLEGFIDFALTESIELAVEYDNIEYIKELNALLPKLSEGTSLDPVEMETRSHIYFYHYSDRKDEMIDYIDREYSARFYGNHEWLFNAAANAVFLDPQYTPAAEKGLEWFQKCIDLSPTQEYYYHLALCEYFTGSPGKTVASLKKSLEFTDDNEVISTTRQIISQIEDEIKAN